VSASPYLCTKQAADYLCLSVAAVQRLAAGGAIPHRKLPGTRNLLFVPSELDAYANGQVELETIERERGGRIVRLKEPQP
jgi:excisionase family DNA binding protein